MWPWEHVAVGYLGYSLYRHAWVGQPPRDRAAVVVVLAALAPDLVDKPLSWAAGVFPTGYAVGHSALVWVGLVVGLFALRGLVGRSVVAAWAIGHGSHLLGDVVYPVVLGEGLSFERVLWPLVTLPPYEERLGLLPRTLRYLHRALSHALAGDVVQVLALEAALLLAVLVLWLYDGRPGLDLVWPADRRVEER